MIKQLIKDIAFDNIKLSQALTRAKLIDNQIKNTTFRTWLNKELEGYEFGDTFLPSYRKIWSTIELIVEFPYGRNQKFPVNLPDSFGKDFLDVINYHRVIEPIAIVEHQIETLVKGKGYINLPPQQTEMLADCYKDQLLEYGGVVRYASRVIGKVQYQNVLEQTKQKLLDTLMQLDNEFPYLIDDYKMSKENNEKVQNIVNNNIYGNNNPLNIVAGLNVEQNIQYSKMSTEDEVKLKSLGVSDTEIKEIKEIIKENKNDKSNLTSKVMKWLGRVTTSVASKGLYDNLPQITEFVQNLIL